MRKSLIAMLGIILISIIISTYFYQQMPEQIASHWNAQGQVNGFMPKFWGMFLLPMIMIGLSVLFIVLPHIDPQKKHIEKCRKQYDRFIIIMLIFMLAIHMQIILWSLGTEIHPNILMPIGIGIIFFAVGDLCEHAKRNWFIGIRTPWTLSNDIVWDKTNILGGRLFKIAGVVSIIGAFFKAYAIYFIIIPIISVAGYTILYSYLEYQKEMKR